MKILPLSLSFNAQKMPVREAHFLKKQLEKAESVDIICHELTDRDSLNSALIAQDYLSAKNIPSRIILSQDLDKLGSKTQFNYVQASDFDEKTKADTILCVDFCRKERVSPQIAKYISESRRVLCIDHHEKPNISGGRFRYVDSTAKSATSVMYRFLEANKEKINSNQAYRIMLGLVDDGLKKGLFFCDSTNGVIIPTEKILKDDNAYEIFRKTYSKLNQEQINAITGKIDVMASLTPHEKEFSDSLYSRLKFSANEKLAYVEIPPDSKEWRLLGGDNARTSTILNRFRQNIINNKFDDERLKNVEAVITFYRADDVYRLSVHSKKPTLMDFYEHIEKTIPDFTQNAGGHPDRAGGKILTTDPEICHEWVMDIVSCADFYD